MVITSKYIEFELSFLPKYILRFFNDILALATILECDTLFRCLTVNEFILLFW